MGLFVLSALGLLAAVLSSEASSFGRAAAAVVAIVGGGLVWRGVARAVGPGPAGRSKAAKLPVGKIIGLGLALALVVLVVALATEVWVAAMVVVATALSAAALGVARETKNDFRWFGVAIFMAVLVFGAAMSVLRTASAVKLQAVAVRLTADAGARELTGLYVASTPDRVYIADVDHCQRGMDLVLRPRDRADNGRIIELPRSAIGSLAIGRLELLQNAKARGPRLLAELRQRLVRSAGAAAAPPHQCATEGIVDLTRRASSTVTGADAEKMARRFRPVLRFDSGERWRPLRIESLLAERDRDRPAHALCALERDGDQRGCEPLASVADITASPTEARVMDFRGTRFGGDEHRSPDRERCPGRTPGDILLDCDSGAATAIYYRVSRANHRHYVDYWWFLRYNRFEHRSTAGLCEERLKSAVIGCFDHEGDWEGVTVVTSPGRPDKLSSVGFASHDGVYRHSVRDLHLQGGRPVVYLAQGSHAAYRVPCAVPLVAGQPPPEPKCKQPATHYSVRLPETNTDGKRGWGRNADAECFASSPCLLPLPAGGWNAFNGRWGSRVCAPGRCRIELGPLTPARQRRYRAPWCATGPGKFLVCDGSYDVGSIRKPTP